MSVLVDQNTRVVVQGLTGREGTFHAQQMLEYGSRVFQIGNARGARFGFGQAGGPPFRVS